MPLFTEPIDRYFLIRLVAGLALFAALAKAALAILVLARIANPSKLLPGSAIVSLAWYASGALLALACFVWAGHDNPRAKNP